MRLCGALGLAGRELSPGLLQEHIWVLWATERESPERENYSPIHPATIRSNWLSSWIGEVNLEPAAVRRCDDV